MTEDQAREFVIATCQVLGCRILHGDVDVNGLGIKRFPIKLYPLGSIVMADDWVTEIRVIPPTGYGIFGFFTWRSAASALANINNRDYDHHAQHQTETDHSPASR